MAIPNARRLTAAAAIACVVMLAAPVLRADHVTGHTDDINPPYTHTPPGNLQMVGDHWTPYDPPTSFPEGANVYIIVQGDTLWDLSEANLGDPYLWPRIWEANQYILDAHWIYRGAGNSAVALFDVVKLYGPRVTELHLRQSVDNVWTEVLSDGDVDYPALASYLLGIGVKPHLVMEQAVEEGTPNTMDAVESHRLSREYARRVFAGFQG